MCKDDYKRLSKKISNASGYAPTVLRVVLGLLFIVHGYGKLFGTPGWEAWQGALAGMLGLPPFFAGLVAVTELLGGALLILGLFTQAATVPLIIVMLVAIFGVKIGGGIMKPELDYTFLIVLVSLFLTGPGKLSLDKRLGLVG